jgi:hypothetical protein
MKNALNIDETTYNENKEILSNLRCGTLSDCVDEFQKSRDYLGQGDLIFTYKNSKDRDTEDTLYGITIRVHNKYTVSEDNITSNLDEYIVEIYTHDYSVIYPHVPRTYLDVELFEFLNDHKVPSDILATYKQIIEDLKQ